MAFLVSSASELECQASLFHQARREGQREVGLLEQLNSKAIAYTERLENEDINSCHCGCPCVLS